MGRQVDRETDTRDTDTWTQAGPCIKHAHMRIQTHSRPWKGDGNAQLAVLTSGEAERHLC
eukprot:36337-Eustigmatos_ZCMA.PRE.1